MTIKSVRVLAPDGSSFILAPGKTVSEIVSPGATIESLLIEYDGRGGKTLVATLSDGSALYFYGAQFWAHQVP